MIFGKYINRYYLKHAPVLLLGLAALLTVDYIQLLIPQLYHLAKVHPVDDQPVRRCSLPKRCCCSTSACP